MQEEGFLYRETKEKRATKTHREDYHVVPEAETIEIQCRPRIPKVTAQSWKVGRGQERVLRPCPYLS